MRFAEVVGWKKLFVYRKLFWDWERTWGGLGLDRFTLKFSSYLLQLLKTLFLMKSLPALFSTFDSICKPPCNSPFNIRCEGMNGTSRSRPLTNGHSHPISASKYSNSGSPWSPFSTSLLDNNFPSHLSILRSLCFISLFICCFPTSIVGIKLNIFNYQKGIFRYYIIASPFFCCYCWVSISLCSIE